MSEEKTSEKTSEKAIKVGIVAGEASGDILAAGLINTCSVWRASVHHYCGKRDVGIRQGRD